MNYFYILINFILVLVFINHYIWGLGIGDWGLGIGDWAQSPIPNPQSPIPNPHKKRKLILSIFSLNLII